MEPLRTQPHVNAYASDAVQDNQLTLSVWAWAQCIMPTMDSIVKNVGPHLQTCFMLAASCVEQCVNIRPHSIW